MAFLPTARAPSGPKTRLSERLTGFFEKSDLKIDFYRKNKMNSFFSRHFAPDKRATFLCLTNFLARFPLEWAKPRKIIIFGGFLGLAVDLVSGSVISTKDGIHVALEVAK